MTSWVARMKFKMADGRHIAKCWKRYNSPISGQIWMKLGWSHPIAFPTCPSWCRCHGNRRPPLPSNGALNFQQSWASGDRMREPILMKFGTQQQIRTTMTVT